MKKRLFIPLMLFASACVVGCSSDDEVVNVAVDDSNVAVNDSDGVCGGVIYDGFMNQEVDESDPVAAFFGKELHGPRWDNDGNEYKTFFEKGKWDDESCLMINSRQEFQTAYMGTMELPYVDFSQYTLIICRTWGNDTACTLDKTILRDMGLTYELEIQLVNHVDWGAYTAIMRIYYWRLYPKLAKKPIFPKRAVSFV